MRRILCSLVALGAVVGLYGAALRFSAEANNRRVEVAVDMGEVHKLAVAEGIPVPAVLSALKEAGVTSVAISEDTIGSLEESRRIEVVSTGNRGTSYMMVHQGNYSRVVEALRQRTHLGTMLSTPAGMDNTQRPMDAGLDIHYPYSYLHPLGVGLDPDLIAQAQAAHLYVVGRIENNDNTPEAGIGWALDQLKAQGVATVIFSGDEILGYASHLKTTAEALRERQLNFGVVEFGKIKGDDQLHDLVPDRAVRVHTVTAAEMATATPGENIQRFSLAARERNIRLLYVRLFLSKANPLAFNTEYLSKLQTSLSRGGLVLGQAHPYSPLSVAPWARALLGLGLGAALILFLDLVCGVLASVGSRDRTTLVVFGGALVVAALPLVPLGGSSLLRVAALISAVLFPTYALLEPSLLAPLDEGAPLRKALSQRLARLLGITSLGICYVVGLLSDLAFLVKADAFLGIKAALYLPLLFAVLVWVFDLRASSPQAWWSALCGQLKRALPLLQDPLRLWQVFVGLGVLVVLGMLWLRSGNEGTAVVSTLELKFRDLLDRVLFVRPRFKANLFAALLLGLYFAGRGQRRLALPFFLLGVIAVTDFLNTFCHLHTPLLVGVVRDLLGPGFGLLIGSAAIWWIERRGWLLSRPEPAA